MLFNSYGFIFGFLPLVLFGFFYLGRFSPAMSSLWLASASVFFYGWWDIRYVALLLASVVFNFAAGYLIVQQRARQATEPPKALLAGAIVLNLMVLGYFKYAHFFAQTIGQIAGVSLHVGDVLLPLGISFFTFTQIAFLVDTYQGKVKELHFIHYALFVTYFPHLIAGPVLHHRDMMPQFAKRHVGQIHWGNMAVGMSIFVLGLAKKVLIADALADYASPVFTAAATGEAPKLFAAWVGALSYTLQLYFDFSAYSDMAVGLSLLLNVRLPMNFNSPYKATSIIDFWRRWHMTLSRFLRDYLYIPLGGSRHGNLRRYINLMLTMLLGGLWHGAGWTFVIWGGLHGGYLMINHAWRGIKHRMGLKVGGKLATLGAGALTFLAVTVGWVFFRADRFATAISLLRGMAGMNGVSFPAFLKGIVAPFCAQQGWAVSFEMGTDALRASVLLMACLLLVWLAPNLWQIFHGYHPTCEDLSDPPMAAMRIAKRLQWQPTRSYALFCALLFITSVLSLTRVSEFLYFQF